MGKTFKRNDFNNKFGGRQFDKFKKSKKFKHLNDRNKNQHHQHQNTNIDSNDEMNDSMENES